MELKNQPLPEDLKELAALAADERNPKHVEARWVLAARAVKALEEMEYHGRDHAINRPQ